MLDNGLKVLVREIQTAPLLGLGYDVRLPAVFEAVTLEGNHHRPFLVPGRATIAIAGRSQAG